MPPWRKLAVDVGGFAREGAALAATIRRALDHVWYDGISPPFARGLLRQGGWANGERLAGQEVSALEALAGGAGPDDEAEVDEADAEG